MRTIRASGRRSAQCRLGWGERAKTLRNWIRRHQVDDGELDGVYSDAAAEIRALNRRNKELEQVIEILKTATGFFARESDPRNHR